MIKVVAFDFGGVLYTWDKINLLKNLAAELRIKSDSVDAAWEKSIGEFEKGRITEKVFWQRFFDFLGMKKRDLRKLRQIVIKQFKPMAQVIKLLKKLKKDHRVALLSNHTYWLNELEKKYHFKKWFDLLVISDHVGLTKPDEKIFRLLVRKAKVGAKEIVFIDDRVEYRKAAEKAGLDFISFKNYKQLLHDLKKLGVR